MMNSFAYILKKQQTQYLFLRYFYYEMGKKINLYTNII